MRYINYILIHLLFLVFWLLGAVLIVPLIYHFRKFIRRNKLTFFWYFLNDTTDGIDAGDFGRYNRNFIGYYRQCALRNSHWNLKLTLVPKQGNKDNLKGKLYAYTTNNVNLLGYNFATYEINNKKYFRFSFNKKIGKLILNSQLGALENRYVFKIRIKKI